MKRLMLLLPMLALNAMADIEYGDLFIRASISFSDNQTVHYGTVPYGDPTKLEVFSTIPTWGKFLLDSSNPHPNSFASALGTGDGDMGVGVSGLHFASNPTYDAPLVVVNYLWTVSNIGTAPVPLGFIYKIPQMELWISNFGEFSHAYTEARLETTQYLADGSPLISDKPFSFWAHLSKKRGELSNLDRSDDLAAIQHESVLTSQYEKITYPILEGWVPLGILEPGEKIDFDYRLLAYIYTSSEAGAQAYVGDPFRVTTGGEYLFEVVPGTGPGVPEPATAGLVLGALAVWIARMRCASAYISKR